MQKPDMELGPRGYERIHIQTVLGEISKRFPSYFKSFCPSAKAAQQAFSAAIAEWEADHPAYKDFLDPKSLKEFKLDHSPFKNALRTKCPIIRQCLNSPAEEMKKYKKDFNLSASKDQLYTITNIVNFGKAYVARFNHKKHEKVMEVEKLGLGDLLEEDFRLYKVIGGSIQSLLLYSLYPHAFPNRSQSSIWALYFLTGKKDFGFSDGSEFLMIDVGEEKSITQQNYHYPYDLFAYYALCLYRILKDGCAKKDIELESKWRYTYVDAFLNHVAEKHQEDIDILKGAGEYGFDG